MADVPRVYVLEGQGSEKGLVRESGVRGNLMLLPDNRLSFASTKHHIDPRSGWGTSSRT